MSGHEDESRAATTATTDDSSRALVGLVVVSHSRALARAAVVLAWEMLHGRPVQIAVAAGLDDVTLGTDAVRIKEAIQEVDSAEGVVVLMDLGSAVLSAELALDLLDDPSVRVIEVDERGLVVTRDRGEGRSGFGRLVEAVIPK